MSLSSMGFRKSDATGSEGPLQQTPLPSPREAELSAAAVAGEIGVNVGAPRLPEHLSLLACKCLLAQGRGYELMGSLPEAFSAYHGGGAFRCSIDVFWCWSGHGCCRRAPNDPGDHKGSTFPSLLSPIDSQCLFVATPIDSVQWSEVYFPHHSMQWKAAKRYHRFVNRHSQELRLLQQQRHAKGRHPPTPRTPIGSR